MNASGRPNTCKSRGITEKLAFLVATGARVRNTYGTCPCQGNSPGKLGLMPHGTRTPHGRSEEHTSELQSRENLVCRLLLEKKNERPTVTHINCHQHPLLQQLEALP